MFLPFPTPMDSSFSESMDYSTSFHKEPFQILFRCFEKFDFINSQVFHIWFPRKGIDGLLKLSDRLQTVKFLTLKL